MNVMFGVSKCLQTKCNVYVTTKDFTRSEEDAAHSEIKAWDVDCRPPLCSQQFSDKGCKSIYPRDATSR